MILRGIRRHTGLAASVMATAGATMLFVTCISSASTTRQQKACCAAMQHDCGGTMLESPCCQGQPDHDRVFVAAKPTVAGIPAAIVVASIDLPVELARMPKPLAPAPRSSSGPPGIPTYVFVSSFRI